MKPEDRINELRRRHVEAAQGGLKGRIQLRRIMHVEVAKGEEEMRKKGIKLHVIPNTNKSNFCPFLRRDVPLIVCLCKSVNYTEKVCFGCERPMEWALAGGYLKAYDARMRVEEYQPQPQLTYLNGVPTVTLRDPYVFQRVELPGGDVLFFKRYADGLVEPDYAARVNNDRPPSAWKMGPEDVAPLNSSIDPAELEERRSQAETNRNRLYRGEERKERGHNFPNDPEAPRKKRRKEE